MKYETPELTALQSAINAVQTQSPKSNQTVADGSNPSDAHAAYEDWE